MSFSFISSDINTTPGHVIQIIRLSNTDRLQSQSTTISKDHKFSNGRSKTAWRKRFCSPIYHFQKEVCIDG